MTTEHDIARRDGQAHHYVWRHALELAKQRAASSGDAAYWDREIEAFDRTFPVLVRQQPQAEVAPTGWLNAPLGYAPTFLYQPQPPAPLTETEALIAGWVPLFKEAPQQAEAVPRWLTYDAASDVLTIHGKRYAAGMFGEKGFLAPVGTLLRIEAGSPDAVTLTTVTQAEAVPEMHDALCPALTGGDCTCTPPDDKAVPNDDARDAARYRRWRFYAWNKPSVAAKLLASAIDPDQIDAAVDAMPHHG